MQLNARLMKSLKVSMDLSSWCFCRAHQKWLAADGTLRTSISNPSKNIDTSIRSPSPFHRASSVMRSSSDRGFATYPRQFSTPFYLPSSGSLGTHLSNLLQQYTIGMQHEVRRQLILACSKQLLDDRQQYNVVRSDSVVSRGDAYCRLWR